MMLHRLIYCLIDNVIEWLFKDYNDNDWGQ